ncbi:MAG TPA: hypothetical protein VLT16_15890, partial [Candidatus Limnocylindrales bacterium]|nr:hypothetical protein [Candidatus Limnocylindrales bacterium]
MSTFYLPKDASKARIREAENARKNRAEILKAYSQGKVTRRELVKWGLFTSAGALAPIGGLNPFVPSANGQAITSTGATTLALSGTVTGLPPSPLFGVNKFSTPMPRFDVLPRNAVSSLTPAPTASSNQTLQAVDPLLGGGFGPIEGRPPGDIWAHQQFTLLPPQVAIEVSQAQAQTNTIYNPQVPSSLNSGINPASP